MADLHRMSPDQVDEYLERLNAAKSMTGAGDEQPPRDLVGIATDYMAAQGVTLRFERILDNDEGLVWQASAATARGTITERPETGEDWTDFLLRQGWLPKGR